MKRKEDRDYRNQSCTNALPLVMWILIKMAAYRLVGKRLP